MGLHRAADVDQNEQTWPLFARRAPHRVQGQAPGAQAVAQRAAQVQASAGGAVMPAARQPLAQRLRNLLCQAFQLRQILRQPLRQASVVQGIGAAGAALGAGQTRLVGRSGHRLQRGIGRASGRGVAWRAGGHALLQALHQLLQVATGSRLAADARAALDTLRVPVALEQLGPASPIAHVVAGDGAPSRIEPGVAFDGQAQGGAHHRLLFGDADREAVVTQQRGKPRDGLQGLR
mmetsp:Transcript_1093/g.2958  ORF Transcript_1093/g.2958 Transcript_1093/m.2958 type:complete len:234 (+) Transcript_1093:2-703(+)